ncbi:hypothetical protein AX17_000563 [Amanita inopinata Kibby_2008]|nr:hypothetical protein AX17_000563 [Amanita inopinata Kibby_2008]
MRAVASVAASVVVLPAFVAAYAAAVRPPLPVDDRGRFPRQAVQSPPAPSTLSSPPASQSGVTSSVSTLPVTGGPVVPVITTATTLIGGSSVVSVFTSTPPVTQPTTIYTFSLESTNPTAVPLSDIVATAASSVTSPLDTTFAPGSVPTFLPGAPPLPNIATLVPANYPPLDKVPPTDSPEVQQWKNDVANSGIQIPDFQPTVLGGCPANPAAATDPNRCWWTCGGCTLNTDVTECPTHMEWGLTYDDGPAYYTSNLLDYLDQQQLKSTFFVVGSRVISFPNILQTEYMGQHQIAVHTWSHPPLTTLTNDEIIAELGWSKKAIKDVLGVTPNMMRPPYGDIDNRVRAISTAMGLTPVMWTRISPAATFDTQDFDIHGGFTPVEKVLQNWELIIGNATQRHSGFIVLEHDLFQQTVEVATGYILPDAIAHNFTIKPVITCLDKPLADAYIELNNNKTNPPPIEQSGVVTLSSGAPGSAQATGKSQSAAVSLHTGAGLIFATMTTILTGFILAV